MTDVSDVLVRVRDLRKSYGSIRAVDGISFEVSGGDILGFLGPNGAGKTVLPSSSVGEESLSSNYQYTYSRF